MKNFDFLIIENWVPGHEYNRKMIQLKEAFIMMFMYFLSTDSVSFICKTWSVVTIITKEYILGKCNKKYNTYDTCKQ